MISQFKDYILSFSQDKIQLDKLILTFNYSLDKSNANLN